MVSQDAGAWAVGGTGRTPISDGAPGRSSAQHWAREPGGV